MRGFIVLTACLLVFVPKLAWAQTEPIYINGAYYISSGQNEQWYGDVTLGPNAELYIEDGQQVLFYGAHFKILPGAKIYGANAAWTTFTQGAGTGSIVFIQPNPNNASTVQQTLDGGWTLAQGNGNTLTSITINNPLGVKLVNTDSRVGTNLNFTTATTGNLYVDANDMRLGTASTITNYNQNNNFVVTASTGHLVKESYTGAFTFPVGMADNDYTPAQVTNIIANGIHVNVTDYAGSASLETGTNGIDRTWNIYADNAAGNSTINLQHNNTTDQANFSETSNFVARYSSLPNNNTGDYSSLSPWQSNTASASGAGSLTTGAAIAAGRTNFRAYIDFATTAADQLAYYTKKTCTPPTPIITALTEACTGDRVLFTTGAFSFYQWIIVSGTGGAVEGTGNTNPAYFSWNMTGQKVVKVTVTNIEGCVGEAQATIDVKQRASTGPMYRLPNKQ